MAIEVEIKLKIEDSGELIKKLKDQHFTTGKTVWESDLYFTSEHRNMKACDEALSGGKRHRETGGISDL